jgi:hypothetical protein
VDSSGALYVADSLNNTIRKGVAGGAANYSPTSGSNATTRSAAALPVGNDPASNGHSPAPITPTPPIIAGKPSGDRLINISTRSMVGTDANVQIAGFVISGATPKQVIIRASGPSLASSFNLTGVLADPMIELHNSATGAVLATNDDWDSALDTAFAAVGAFPWAVGSKDSALAASLAPGMYTVVVKGKNNGTGIALVEVYDADASATAPKLINISTRSFVGTGDNVQIAGFVVGGNVAKKVVIRAAGPALASNFGISGALANPVLELHSQGMDTPLADVENWDASLASDFAAVGAFPWTAGSKDAALVTTLNPGPYTVVVKGKNDGTGVALVEVYEESN